MFLMRGCTSTCIFSSSRLSYWLRSIRFRSDGAYCAIDLPALLLPSGTTGITFQLAFPAFPPLGLPHGLPDAGVAAFAAPSVRCLL